MKPNLSKMRLNILIFNNFCEKLSNSYRQAFEAEFYLHKMKSFYEINYGVKIDSDEMNRDFSTSHPELQKQHIDGLNSGIVYSTLATFVCELSLKYLIEKEGKKFKNIHDIEKLYQTLDGNNSTEIKRETMRISRFNQADFDGQLHEVSNNFVTLRYFYEKDEVNINFMFLDAFRVSLIKLISEAQPH